MPHRLNAQHIKIHRQYTYDQAAQLVGRSVQTVRAWRKDGLKVLDGKIPHLIIGADLKAFLCARKSRVQQKLALDEFNCLRCKAPVRAYGGMADYEAFTPARGVLKTLCATCETPCQKFASLAQVELLREFLTIENSDRCDD